MRSFTFWVLAFAVINIHAEYWPQRNFWERIWYGEAGCSRFRWRGWGGLTGAGYQQELDCLWNTTAGVVEEAVDIVASEVADVVTHEVEVVGSDVKQIFQAAETAVYKLNDAVEATVASAQTINEEISQEKTLVDDTIGLLEESNSSKTEKLQKLDQLLQMFHHDNDTMATEIQIVDRAIKDDKIYEHSNAAEEITLLEQLKNDLSNKEVTVGAELGEVASNATNILEEMLQKDASILYQIFHPDNGSGHVMAYIIVIGLAVTVVTLLGTFITICCPCCKKRRENFYNEDFA